MRVTKNPIVRKLIWTLLTLYIAAFAVTSLTADTPGIYKVIDVIVTAAIVVVVGAVMRLRKKGERDDL